MKTRIVLFSFLIGCCLSNYAQDFYDDYSFFHSQSLPVIIENNRLSMPWAGGMNSVRFSEIDLDNDGANDLFAFEKHGNRILTFLRRGDHYIYAPEYVRYFPNLHDWSILKDNRTSSPTVSQELPFTKIREQQFRISSSSPISYRLFITTTTSTSMPHLTTIL